MYHIYVNNSFASTILYIPSEWKVEIYVNNTLGTTQEKGQSNQHGSNILNIYGVETFGCLGVGLEILWAQTAIRRN